MTSVNNFDVLKKMSADNLDIRLGTDFLGGKTNRQGCRIEIGIAGNPLGELLAGDLRACLILFNKKQFDETKAKLETE